MAGRAGDALGDGGFAVGDDAVADFVDLQAEPAGRLALFGVVGGAVVIDAAGLAEAVVLLELGGRVGVVNGVGTAF